MKVEDHVVALLLQATRVRFSNLGFIMFSSKEIRKSAVVIDRSHCSCQLHQDQRAGKAERFVVQTKVYDGEKSM